MPGQASTNKPSNNFAGGRIYPCTCTRADIAHPPSPPRQHPHDSDVQVRYPGTCRGRYASLADAQATGKPVCWRVAVRPTFRRDALRRPHRRPAVFRRRPGCRRFPPHAFQRTPAYQLACVVDDAAMGIDCVIRGDDLLSSTPRRILLYHALGLPVPQIAHVPLVIRADGHRLAQRHGESRIAQFREHGVPSERIVGWAAWRFSNPVPRRWSPAIS